MLSSSFSLSNPGYTAADQVWGVNLDSATFITALISNSVLFYFLVAICLPVGCFPISEQADFTDL